MSLKTLPKIKIGARPQNLQWDAPSDILEKWAETPLAAGQDGDATILIFDPIGMDDWSGDGATAKRIGAELRALGDKAVTVKINSPGGDVFEGVAIYNLLRAHPAKVTVEIIGWAASIASVIAMAGDEIKMGLGSFLMVHNAWCMCVGNRHDLREVADLLEGFDAALVDIYAARNGGDRKDIEKLMDAETFMSAADAKARGFVDVIDETLEAKASAEPTPVESQIASRRKIEAGLARAGMSRRDRSHLIGDLIENSLAGRDAGQTTAERDAGIELEALNSLLNHLKS